MRSREGVIVLLAEIRGELEKLQGLFERILSQRGEIRGADDERVESAALRLHNLYTGCERIFKLVANEVDGGIPETPDWHKRLLTHMTLEITDRRPALISETTLKGLEELLAFRHVVRNLYGYELDADRIGRVIEVAAAAFPRLAAEVREFLEFLDAVSRQA